MSKYFIRSGQEYLALKRKQQEINSRLRQLKGDLVAYIQQEGEERGKKHILVESGTRWTASTVCSRELNHSAAVTSLRLLQKKSRSKKLKELIESILLEVKTTIVDEDELAQITCTPKELEKALEQCYEITKEYVSLSAKDIDRRCSFCSARLRQTDLFCPKCGEELLDPGDELLD